MVDASEIDGVLEFENSRTSVGLNVPLSYSAVLRRAKQTANFKSQVVDFVCVSYQRLKLVLLLELLIVVDFPKADQAVPVARKHLYNLGAVKTERS